MDDTLEGLAGTMPDARVAERLGIEVDAVKAWRREHGIAPYLQAPPEPARREPPAAVHAATGAPTRREVVRRRANDATVEAVSFREVRAAEAPAIPETPIRRVRTSAGARLDVLRDRMGTVPDDVIAAEAGVSRGVVGAYRRKHGIRAYEGYLFQAGHAPLPRRSRRREAKRRPPAGENPKRASRIDRFADLVGVESDARVAELAGVGRTAVTAWRARHGIAATAARGRGRRDPDAEVTPEAPRPAPRVRSAGPRGLRAFTVVASANGMRREFVAVGEDMAEACRKAQAGLEVRSDGPWLVDEVRVLGEALG